MTTAPPNLPSRNRQFPSLFVLFAALLLASSPLWLAPAAHSGQDERLPPPSRYQRTLGPFPLEGRPFTLKLSILCYKESQHPGMCNEDDEETVTSLKIDDDAGKTRFSKSFPVSPVHNRGRHLVSAALLEGRDHQALEVIYDTLPSPPNSGESIQIFGLQNGSLQPFDLDPLEFRGGLAPLPPGKTSNSRRLLDNDTLQIYSLTNYFFIVAPVRLNWKDFSLDQQDSGEFAVANQPPYRIRPEITSERPIHIYPSPDAKSKAIALNLTPQSHIELLKARFRAAPPQDHDSPTETWLQVRIDGREGWILGVDDYTALGLSSLGPDGPA